MPHSVRKSSRVAAATFRGYYYQTLYTVLRWLELPESSRLIVEGNEDIDRTELSADGSLIFVEEQIRLRASSRPASSTELTKTVLNFVEAFAYHQRNGTKFEAILRTNASLSAGGRTSAVRQWAAGNEPDEQKLLAEIAAAASKLDSRHLNEAVAMLKRTGQISAFIKSVEWARNSPVLAEVENLVLTRLRSLTSAVPDHRALSAYVCAVLKAACCDDPTKRTVSAWDWDLVLNTLLVDQLATEFSTSAAGQFFCLSVSENALATMAAVVSFDNRDKLLRVLKREHSIAEVEQRPAFSDGFLTTLDCVMYATIRPRPSNHPVRVAARDVLEQATCRWRIRALDLSTPP